MSLGTDTFSIAVDDSYIASIDTETLEYTTGIEAMSFSVAEGGELVSALRKKYPDTTFEVVPD